MTARITPRIDFAHHSDAYTRQWEHLVRDLHGFDFPLAWSEAYGGFWVLGSWQEVKRAAEDWETFSADNDSAHERRGGRGSRIPPDPYQLKLSESDPPFHTARRRLELPFFVPKAVREYLPKVESFIDDAIASVRDRTEVDLLWDIVLPVTARTTLHLIGYGDKWADVARSVHLMSYMKPDDRSFPIDQATAMREGFRAMIAERRTNPRGDIASALAQGLVLGNALTDDEAESMMTALVFGGFDTITTAAIDALSWLETRPEQRAQLVRDESLLSNAIDEWLRVWPPSHGIARTVMRDIEIGGRQLQAGQRIYLWFAAANRDPAHFPEPEVIQLDRKNARDHMAFSAGNHRCLGAILAKLELKAMLHAILTRIPEYRIDHTRVGRFPSFAAVAGYLDVPMKIGAIL